MMADPSEGSMTLVGERERRSPKLAVDHLVKTRRSTSGETVTAIDDVTFEVHQSHLCGDEVANVVTLHITQASGAAFQLPCVICYKATPDGKIASLRAFWETGNIPGF